MSLFTTDDVKYMNMALALAEKARGKTSPNPLVGAIIVKNNQIIGQGYHQKAGTPHAEIHALNQTNGNASNATLYVTLEPCSHQGRTPACTERIINEKISRVVIAMQDPNPLVNGKGIHKLQAAGILVQTGLLEAQAKQLNEFFTKFIIKNLPFITIKAAISIDGKICTRTGDSQWISNELSRQYVHTLRSYHDAVLTGIGTILQDNPRLSCRMLNKPVTYPWRIILDSKLSIHEQSTILNEAFPEKIIIATTKMAPVIKKGPLQAKGINLITTDDQQVNLLQLLKILAKKEITSILVEGGSSIYTSFMEANLIDKLILFIAPKIIGGKDALTFIEGLGIAKIQQGKICKLIQIKQFQDDIMLEYNLQENNEIRNE